VLACCAKADVVKTKDRAKTIFTIETYKPPGRLAGRLMQIVA
jgi:hypothetical protein